MDIVKIIKNAIDANKVTIGTDITLKQLNLGKIDTVILSANCPEKTKRDIESSARHSSAKVYIYEGTARDLGAIARRPHSIATLGIKKQ